MRKRELPRAGRVVFFTGDLLVSEAGVWREMAPRFVLFEPPVAYNSLAPAEIEAATTAAPSPKRWVVGVDSGSMAVTVKRVQEEELCYHDEEASLFLPSTH